MRKLFLLAAMALTCLGMMSFDNEPEYVTYDNIEYEIWTKYDAFVIEHAIVHSVLSQNSNVNIPDSVMYEGRWFPVTEIGHTSIIDVKADSITIGNNIRKFGFWAFFQEFSGNTYAYTCESYFRYVNCKSLETWCSIEYETRWSSPFAVIPSREESDTLGYDHATLCINDTILRDVRIPETIDIIKEYAFYNCRHIQSVTIPANVKKIEGNSFIGCDSLRAIYIESPEPPELPQYYGPQLEYAFPPKMIYSGTLYVPAGHLEEYKAIPGWKEFRHIEEYTPSDVDEIATPSAEVRVKVSGNTVSFEGGNSLDGVTVFDISGRTVYSGMAESLTLPRGIYILRTKARTIKFKV